MRPLRCVLAFTVLLVMGTVANGLCADRITIPGTGDSQELLRAMAAAFGKKHPNVVIDVPDSIGTSGGIKAVLAGQAQIARVARPPRDKEQKEQLRYEAFAYSAVAFATSAGVEGVSGLTFRQILGIYGGTVTNWKEVGGRDGTIYVMNREEGDSSRTVLEDAIPGFKELTPVGERVYTTPDAVKTLRTYPNTIGYVPLASLRGSGLAPLVVNGVAPQEETVRDGRYPLVVPLGFVWREELRGALREFLLFVKSKDGQKLLRANGAVPATR